jgi:predicted AlkP superfamily pyrophosphatase or phosphodiesterase
VHLSQITPSLFASLGLSDASDQIQCGPSPVGRELLFLVDGLGADAVAKYASYIPTLSSLIRHGAVKTSFPSTTATSLATLTTGVNPWRTRNAGLHRASSAQRRAYSKFAEVG